MNGYDSSLATIKQNWDFTITNGYNKILLKSLVQIEKGSLILLNQNSARIALHETITPSYSDLVYFQNSWNVLDVLRNKKFALNPLTYFNAYKYKLNLIHQYTQSGSYDIILTFNGINQSFMHTILISDCKENSKKHTNK